VKQPVGRRSETWQCDARTTTSTSPSARQKELIVDYRIRRGEHAPIHIGGAVVEQVESFKFLRITK
jgi:hypothetical protein